MEKHTTVLLREAVDALAITSSSTVVDATVGRGGHAREMLERLGKGGTYMGIDADPIAIKDAEESLTGMATRRLVVGNFRNINSLVNEQGIEMVDGVLADLGWRMEQFSGNGKGFSFQVDEPLIMTYGEAEQYPFTAYDIVNSWEEENIVSVIEGYGEERYARRIAHRITEAREKAPIETTFALREVIEAAVPLHYRNGKINPSTRTFQALRIAVNDELGALEAFITGAFTLLKPHGRLAIITFHSLEDRIVKHRFRSLAHDLLGTLITKRPILPTREETESNRRARSAKLRIIEKI